MRQPPLPTSQEEFLQLPILTGEDVYVTDYAKKTTGLDGWGWNELKALPLSKFVGLICGLQRVEDTGPWPQGLLDSYITIIPKGGAYSTPSGQRPSCVPSRGLQVMGISPAKEVCGG